MSKIRMMKIADVAVVLLLASLISSAPVLAQGDPRSNVNLIGMTPDPADFPDRRYRQQNEPACAVRPGDSACIICAYNDYRAVDTDIGFGDAWEGVSQSCDAGDTWLSRLAPGHPLYEPAAYRIPAQFAADPRLAAIPGMAIFNFIAGYRDTNVGVLAIQHWLEVNKEDADYYEPGRQTYIADEGTSGRFLDKPEMIAVLDPPGKQTMISLDTAMENSDLGLNGVITREFPSGTLYVAYAVFTGSNSVKVLVKVSHDWGRTFKNQAMKLSEDQNQVSGITLTAIGNKVLAVWRRKGDGNDVDSIMYSVISNGGKKATKGEVLADVCAFDQPTLTGSETDFDVVTFRTNDFPWTANDGENFYVFYSDRGRDSTTGACLTEGKPRIVMHHSTLSGQQAWNDYGPIDQTATASTFQFMPTAFGANGKVQVAWYDTRRDPSDPLALPFVADYNAGQFLVNRTVDVFTTTVTVDGGIATIPGPVRASQFSILVNEKADGSREELETEASFANSKLFAQGNAPFLGDYIAIAAREYRRNSADTAWESNATAVVNGNEDFFVAWTDNRDVRGTIAQITDTLDYSFDPVSTTTTSLDSELGAAAKQLLADTQSDVGPPRDTMQTAEGIDGTDVPSAACYAPTERTRDANIYGSLIKDRARIYAATPSKPLGGLQRTFPVVISNSDDIPKSYTLKIIPGACSSGACQASFRQHPILDSPVYDEPPSGSTNPFLTVPAKSSIARTVFVVGNQSPIKVEARDDTGSLVATIQLANAPQFLDPENCTSATILDPTINCSVATNELHNLELKTVDVHLLDLLTAGNELDALPILSSGDGGDASSLIAWAVLGGCCNGEDPASLGSVIEFAVENIADETVQIDATLDNAALLNAALLNAALLNANLLNASLLNAALLNANLLNSSPTDLSVLDAELVTTAIDGGCCFIELEPTYGSIIAWHLNNPEFINASLLNAALLNAALLNANLLNANLLNANLLNANLLNANLLNAALLNASLLNAALLNPDIEAAALLNANLLNADLLNASLLNPTMVALAEEGGCCDATTEPTAVDVIIYAVGHPEIINASLLNAALLNANLLNADLLNANLLNANLLNADLLNANLLNADLLNANLLNANLLNADLLNANLLNANLLNSTLYDQNTGEATVYDEETGTVTRSSTVPVTFDDYTYPITNNGNVTTAIDADITINAPIITVDGEEVMNIIGTKLITWTANATPAVVDCVERVQLNTRVQSIVATDSSFDIADIDKPFNGQVSGVVAPGETVFVTLRVIGTTEQLKNVRVSGFTASSQAANCYDTVNGPVCDTQLNDGIEQIIFADLEPPVITVPSDITVEASSSGTIVDYTVTVFDSSDSSPSLDCMPESGSLFYLGVTPVTCNATDASGNMAESAIFNINVADTQMPVITMLGLSPATVEVGDAYTDAGAVASDSADGNLTPAIMTVITVDASTVGSYTVTYDVTDSSLNVAVQVTRIVNVTDTTAPVITMLGLSSITVEVGASYTDAGATADDIGDGDVTGSIVTDNPVNTAVVGSYTITYDVTDSSTNAATQVTRTVNVVDTTAPIIALLGISPETVEVGSLYTDAGATASDIGDGDLTLSIMTINSVDTATVGSYTVTYDVSDLSTNVATQVTRTVDVVDTTAPVITLAGVSPVIVEAGSTYLDAGATATDIGDGDLTGTIVTASLVNTSILGTYTVTYNVMDSSMNAADQVSRSVIVQDTTIPTISLLGANPQVIEAGAPYVELTATASDPVFGDISGSMVIDTSNVDTGTVGSYAVTYNVMDASGNAALEVSRSITVQDTTSPVIDPIALPGDLTPNSPYPFELAADANTITVTWPIGVADADPNVAISCSIDGIDLLQSGPLVVNGDQFTATFSYDFPVGPTTVICVATDSVNPETTLQFTIDVLDVTPPAAPAIPPDDFTGVEATSPNGATVGWAPLFADDAVDGSVAAVCSSTSPSIFPIGTTTVSCAATDAAGLTGLASTFDVTVVDSTAPTLTGVPTTTIIVAAGATGTASPDVYRTITASDTADAAPTLVCGPTTPLPFGTNTITCTATDASGNAASASYVIDVIDETGPVITLIGPTSITLEAGVDSYTEQGASAFDNVDGDISSAIVVTGPVDTSTVGTYTVDYDVTDNQGLKAVTKSRVVTVSDTIAPVITAPTSPLVITTAVSPAAVSYDVSVFDVGYPGTTATCVPASGGDFVWGDTPVTCNASDGSGNPANSATFTVTLRYLYDIEVILPKRATKAGSTMPLDWQYKDWGSGSPVDSSAIAVGIQWAETSNCLTPIASGQSGEDSGSSDFRYSASSMLWQYSWQTPATKGKFLVTISPPGIGVPQASACVTLK
jgi:uncharacterized protein YjbI with pentapeptide repeats